MPATVAIVQVALAYSRSSRSVSEIMKLTYMPRADVQAAIRERPLKGACGAMFGIE